MAAFKQPSFNDQGFTCPHCNTYAHHEWVQASHIVVRGHTAGPEPIPDLFAAQCNHCHESTIWYKRRLVYPDSPGALPPNNDLRADIKQDYLEASSIVNKSPRGAAALLRLCVQKLCEQIGEPGKDINTDIGNLVKKGLNPKIQKSLDIVRVIGNNAVHPGTIDLKDDRDTSTKLFGLVNLIAQVMITQPKEIDQLYGALPDSPKKAIEARDKQH